MDHADSYSSSTIVKTLSIVLCTFNIRKYSNQGHVTLFKYVTAFDIV